MNIRDGDTDLHIHSKAFDGTSSVIERIDQVQDGALTPLPSLIMIRFLHLLMVELLTLGNSN